jgi:hypothetical protein
MAKARQTGAGIMIRKIPFLLTFSLFLVPASSHAKINTASDKVWIVIRPVQCLGNPWEKFWLANHNNQGHKYPYKKEDNVIRDFFYKKKQIGVYQVRIQRYKKGDPLCHTCDCPRGDTLYLLVLADDVPQMVAMGYTERVAAADVPEAPKKHEK